MSILDGFINWVTGKGGKKQAGGRKPDTLLHVALEEGDVRETLDDVGIASIKGKRDYQEDRFYVRGGLDIGSANAQSFLADAFNKAATATETLIPGSTATGVVLTTDLQLNTAFLGDSPVVVFIHDPATGEVTGQQLSRNHSPKQLYEKERIKAAGGIVNKDNRLQSLSSDGKWIHTYAVSRAFGDDSATGMSREPEFAAFDLKKEVDAGKSVYVVVSSDGLYDKSILENYIDTFKQAIAKGREDNLAEFLTARALKRGSKDNITALVYKVPKTMEADLFLSVADGHGGYLTSQTVVDTFAAEVKSKIRPPAA